MPFQSKAQQRFMFARHPEKAKEWAKETPNMRDLPEKKHKKTAGLFFKSAGTDSGHFFRDLPGRSDGSWHEKAAADGDAMMPQGNEASDNIDGPSGMANDGEEGGGGMYGTGKPKKPPAPKKQIQPTKLAAKTPDEWDANDGLPTGFHRPAREQPQALEAGGERFHSSEERAPSYGSETQRHGLVEGGSMKLRASSSPNMGKHAAPRFLGTPFQEKRAEESGDTLGQAKEWGKSQLGQAKQSLGEFGSDLAGKAKGAVNDITKSPTNTALAALVLGHVGLGALKRGGGAAKRLLGHHPPVPQGVTGRALGYLRNLATEH